MEIVTSKPTLKRLPQYYKIVCQLQDSDKEFISSAQLAKIMGIDESQVRRDFSSIKLKGKSSAGFKKDYLKKYLESVLGLKVAKDIFIVGVGNLGSAIACCDNNERYGLNVLALFDYDQSKVDTKIAGKTVFHLSRLPNLAFRLNVKTAVLTVPKYQAQEVTDFLVASGIKAIWNFTQCNLQVPEDVLVKDEDILDSFIDFSISISQTLNIWENACNIGLAG